MTRADGYNCTWCAPNEDRCSIPECKDSPMTTPTTPTDAMVALERALRASSWSDALTNVHEAIAALQHQEPGGAGGVGAFFKSVGQDRLPAIDWSRRSKPAATPPAPSALDRAVEALEGAKGYMLNAVIDLNTGTKKETTLSTLRGGIKTLDLALEAIRGNGGGTEKVTDSCGCVYCDLNVPKATLKGVAYHEEPDGNLIQCEAPDDRR